MKTHKNLYTQVCDFENIYLAYRKARKGKRVRIQAAMLERVQDDEMLALQDELQTLAYKPGAYNSFFIHDPKKRLISAAPFRDRVVHHALCNVMEPIWERLFIHDTYANRVGKGTHRALDRTQEFARRYKYFLQCDVRQFFASIDHAILMAEFTRRIKDDKFLWLCETILKSGEGVLANEYDMHYFDGDYPSTGSTSSAQAGSGQGLFSANRARGLPIGNLTSQFWANVYLNDLDHFIKRELKCEAYLRYADDSALFSNDKIQLADWREQIIQKTAALRISLHEECAQIFPTATGIPFLGFRIYSQHRLLKTRKAIYFRRKLSGLLEDYADGRVDILKLHQTIQSWIHYVGYGDTWGLRRSILAGAVL